MSDTPPVCLAIMGGAVIYKLFTWNRRKFGMSITAALISTVFQSLAFIAVGYIILTVSSYIVMMILPGGHQIINILIYVVFMIAAYFVANGIGRLVSSFFNAHDEAHPG